MELRKLAVALDNAKDELKRGVTAGFEMEILFQCFKEFAELHYILTGDELDISDLADYLERVQEDSE